MAHKRFRQPHSNDDYGVLVGRITTDGQANPAGTSPHYEILVDSAGMLYRLAVNIRSVEGSEVLVYFDRNYARDTKIGLAARAGGPHGFTEITKSNGGEGLDYVRDDLFPLGQMTPIPPGGNGVTLSALLNGQIERAKQDSRAVVIAVGDKFDDNQTAENVGFALGRGIHDIQMMQGNGGKFARDNRINGDGALFVRFSGGETITLFVRFSLHSVNTDDNGDPRTGRHAPARRNRNLGNIGAAAQPGNPT